MYGLAEYNNDLARSKASGASIVTAGKSTLGRDIHLMHKGSIEGAQVFVHAGIHAREYITTPLVMRLMEHYTGSGGVWCVPSANIDGMLLVTDGISSVADKARRDFLIGANAGSEDFTMWKANANAVDINVNFAANWGMGKGNIHAPASADYIGPYPFSEVESCILAGITYRIGPVLTLSYHTKGNVVYHGYMDNNSHEAEAKIIANYINYPLMCSRGSFGGYKDWFMATTPYLGLTIECGNDCLLHPIGMGELDNLYKVHEGILDVATREVAHL